MSIIEFFKTKFANIAFGGARGSGRLKISDLTPAQREFYLSTAKHTMIGGPHGAGKTYIVRKVIAQYAQAYRNTRICVFGVDRRALDFAYVKPMREELGGKVRYGQYPRPHLILKNGSRIDFGNVPYETAEFRFAGQQYEVIVLFNAQEFTERQWEFFTGLNRTATRRRPIMLYEAMPGGPGYEWIKRLFVYKNYRQNEQAKDYRFVSAAPKENKYLMQDDAYQKALHSMPEDLHRKCMHGDWNNADEEEKP